ncbi:MAG: CRTAC1 family protein [Acidobacteriota bacterium]|nr:CRTAC1 family protein [Acidobacteriota bacterium]
MRRRVGLAASLMAGVVSLHASQPRAPITFTDATARAGITFVHHNGAAGDMWYPELFGGGVAVLDINGDAWPDLLFVNGKGWQPGAPRARHGLYLNNRDGTFKDVLAGSGFDSADVYGLGATIADYDNDGRDDVFMTTVAGGRLFHNDGGAKFTDVTARAGIRNAEFTVSAAWLDYDRDGLSDLFIGNYVRWTPGTEVVCAQDGVRGYCGPNAYKPVAPALYRNRGGGRFEDVTARAGLDHPTDKAMGVAVLDYNVDGWPDIFVGSDRVPAKLHRNDRQGRFVDEGVPAGVALSENGAARANMGADAADYDRSGRPHVVVGNFLNEMLGLYRNRDGAVFEDVAPRSAVGRASLLSVTWAVFFLDYDLDGFLDIFAANGGTDESQAMDSRARLSQPPLLFRNQGKGTFENVTKAVGDDFNRPIMGRGAAYADFDGDGDLDIAVATLAGPAYLFRNDGGNQQNWLRVRAIGSRSNRSGLGTMVRVTGASGTQTQMVRSGSSYASQSELTLTFGLGRDTSVSAVTVQWPSGKTQTFTALTPNQVIVIDEERGLGRAKN